jgi:hypothetical protein
MSLAPPLAGPLPETPLEAPAGVSKAVSFGVYNGVGGFSATQPIDVSKTSDEERIDAFNVANPRLGREVRYYVVNEEVE